jgi:uncharacterized protein YwqG
MSLQDILVILDSRNVLAALSVAVVIGLGVFLDKRFWPWFTVYFEKRREDNVALRQKELDVKEKNDLRWYRTSDKFMQEMQTTAVILTTFRELLERVSGELAEIREELKDDDYTTTKKFKHRPTGRSEG